MPDEAVYQLKALKEALQAESPAAGDLLTPRTFNGRLAFQKITYLAQRFGGWPGTPIQFGRYVRGPYSPRLAMAYFNLDTNLPPQHEIQANLQPEAKQKLVEWLEKGPKFLEAVASIDATVVQSSPKGANLAKILQEASEKVRARKPFLDQPTIEEAKQELLAQYSAQGIPTTNWLR